MMPFLHRTQIESVVEGLRVPPFRTVEDARPYTRRTG